MPIYEFECQSCGNQFETIQSFSSTSSPACSNCASENVSRQMSKPAIHFKGSGWYITDSKKSDKKSANGASENGTGEKSTEKPAAENKSDSSNESKPKVEKSAEKSTSSSDS